VKDSLKSLLELRENNDESTLEYLAKSSLPLVIYGAGVRASRLAELLSKNNIHNYVFAVDRGFEKEGTVFFSEEIDGLYEKYNLLLGHSFLHSLEIPPQFKHAAKMFSIVGVTRNESISHSFLEEHLALFEETLSWQQDELSVKSMLAYLKGKLTYNGSYLVPYIKAPQYFQQEIFTQRGDIVYVDCGAYTGDTIAKFITFYPNYNKIIAVEPSPSNLVALQAYIERERLKNIEIVQKGCADYSGVVKFVDDCGNKMGNMISENGNLTIEVEKMDNFVDKTSPVSLIKMDIEGAELSALKGARETILRNEPVLAICAYHKPDDLITIPQYIKSLVPEYRFYFRLHPGALVLDEAVLYAVTDKHAVKSGE
jgi:FkbM family methyltransferase